MHAPAPDPVGPFYPAETSSLAPLGAVYSVAGGAGGTGPARRDAGKARIIGLPVRAVGCDR